MELNSKELQAHMSGIMLNGKYALVDLKLRKVLIHQGKRLSGHCNLCGKCCMINKDDPPGVPFPDEKRGCCKHLVEQETPTGPRHTCAIYNFRPLDCCLWPLNGMALPEGCTYYYGG